MCGLVLGCFVPFREEFIGMESENIPVDAYACIVMTFALLQYLQALICREVWTHFFDIINVPQGADVAVRFEHASARVPRVLRGGKCS